MAQLFYIKGQGHFETQEGKLVNYPINKLIVCNENNEELEIKLDKTSNRILPFMFTLEESDRIYVTESGDECKLYFLKEKLALDERE